MATLAVTHPTLADLTKRLDPNGKIDGIVEILNETNEVIDDMVYVEGNLPTGHRTTIRTGLPAPTWRKLYGGVQPTKSTTVQVTDTIGNLEAYAEVDKLLADLNGNTASFRMSEERAHIEGMNIEFADTLFYGNEGTAPEEFTGLAPRYNDPTAANGDNMINGGGTGSDNASIWLVCWGPNTIHGIYPKGSMAGLEHQDLGEVTVENVDGSNGRAQMYRSHYKWSTGLSVRDWRYAVRICNIDVSELTKNAASGADLIDLMTQALEKIPSLGMGRPAFYMPRNIRSVLRRQMVNKVASSTLTMQDVGGKQVMMFDTVPVRRCDSLLLTEAAITFA